jgi:hypothetical protein
MIEELERRRQEREELDQGRPWLEIPAPEPASRGRSEPERPRSTVIVIDL